VLDEPEWITREMLDAMHADQIRQHGGSYGVRDAGLLESALMRPQNRWRYESDSDLSTLAASYAFGLAKNHGYVDGNKRVAFSAAYLFLALNGWEIDTPEPEVVAVMVALASGGIGEEHLTEWLRVRIIPLPEDV
jgi:death-on-curing protein